MEDPTGGWLFYLQKGATEIAIHSHWTFPFLLTIEISQKKIIKL